MTERNDYMSKFVVYENNLKECEDNLYQIQNQIHGGSSGKENREESGKTGQNNTDIDQNEDMKVKFSQIQERFEISVKEHQTLKDYS